MMQLITRFIDLSQSALEQQVSIDEIGALPVIRRLRRMGEEINEEDTHRFETLGKALEAEFTQLTARAAADVD